MIFKTKPFKFAAFVVILQGFVWTMTTLAEDPATTEPTERQIQDFIVPDGDAAVRVPVMIRELEIPAVVEVNTPIQAKSCRPSAWRAESMVEWDAPSYPPERMFHQVRLKSGSIKNVLDEFVHANPGSTWSYERGLFYVTFNATAGSAFEYVNKLQIDWKDLAVDPPNFFSQIGERVNAAIDADPGKIPARFFSNSLFRTPLYWSLARRSLSPEISVTFDRTPVTVASIYRQLVLQSPGRFLLTLRFQNTRQYPGVELVQFEVTSWGRSWRDSATEDLIQRLDPMSKIDPTYESALAQILDVQLEIERRELTDPYGVESAILKSTVIEKIPSFSSDDPWIRPEDQMRWLLMFDSKAIHHRIIKSIAAIKDSDTRIGFANITFPGRMDDWAWNRFGQTWTEFRSLSNRPEDAAYVDTVLRNREDYLAAKKQPQPILVTPQTSPAR